MVAFYGPTICQLKELCEEKNKMVQGFSKFQMKKVFFQLMTGKRRHVGMNGAKDVFRKIRSK